MTNSRPILRAALVVALAVGLYAAPAPADDASEVLATVDGKAAVTADDVRYLFRADGNAAARVNVTADDVARAVDTLVTAKILVIEAEDAGYDESEHFKNEMTQSRRKALHELMLRTLEEEVTVTEEDLRDYYEKDLKWRKYSVIICKNREEAEAARRELDQGKPWDEVFADYAINFDKSAAGAYSTPMIYDGREAARAVFVAEEGAYTPAVRSNDGIRWLVFRADKIVHGSCTSTFDEARPTLISLVSKVKAGELAERIVAELRTSVPIQRNAEMWQAVMEEPYATFEAEWGVPGVIASDVGGISVTGGDFAFLIYDYAEYGAAGPDALRESDPDDFAYVMDRVLARLEDEALLGYEATRRGLDRSDEFVRYCENWRSSRLTDQFVAWEFAAKLPPLTDDYLQHYYDTHPENFLVPEILECYIIVLPDRDKVQAFYERVVSGENIIDVGETYNQARGRELMNAYETPPTLPPEKEDFVRAITVNREPNAGAPELPLATDLRGRVFDTLEPGTLSDVFQLTDGRWAFYRVTFYQPPGKEELSDEGGKTKCSRLAWSYYLKEDEDAERRAEEWLASLRDKHTISLTEERYADVAAEINEPH